MRRIFTTILLAASIIATAQKPGTLDKTFGNKGKIVDSSRDYFISGQNGLVLPSDKYLVATSIDDFPSYPGVITRYLPDGKVDSTFATNGKFIESSPIANNSNIRLLRQSSGKIIWVTDRRIIRFFANGSIDSSFGKNGICSTDTYDLDDFEQPADAVLQADGKITTTGTLYPLNEFGVAFIRRYTANGKKDLTFGDSGRVIITEDQNIVELNGRSVISLADGSIIGGIDVNGGNSYFILQKLQPNGRPDSSFGKLGLLRSQTSGREGLEAVAEDAAGNILATGNALRQDNVGGLDVVTRRYNRFGKVDKSFGVNGVSIVAFDTLNCYSGQILIQKDGKIVINNPVFYYAGGGSYPSYFSMLRLQTNGRLDSSFGKYGKTIVVAPDTRSSFLGFQSTGKILFAGTVYNRPQNSNSTLQLRFYNNGNAVSVIAANTIKTNVQNTVSISVSPNPAKDILRISGLPANTKANISVVERGGNVLIAATANSSSYSLNISRLHSGLYNLVVSVNGKTQTLQFLKE